MTSSTTTASSADSAPGRTAPAIPPAAASRTGSRVACAAAARRRRRSETQTENSVLGADGRDGPTPPDREPLCPALRQARRAAAPATASSSNGAITNVPGLGARLVAEPDDAGAVARRAPLQHADRVARDLAAAARCAGPTRAAGTCRSPSRRHEAVGIIVGPGGEGQDRGAEAPLPGGVVGHRPQGTARRSPPRSRPVRRAEHEGRVEPAEPERRREERSNRPRSRSRSRPGRSASSSGSGASRFAVPGTKPSRIGERDHRRLERARWRRAGGRSGPSWRSPGRSRRDRRGQPRAPGPPRCRRSAWTRRGR